MTAKEYLERARWIDKEIKYEKENMERVRAQAEGRSSPQVTGMPRGGGGKDNASLIAKLVEISRHIDELEELKGEIEGRIDRIKDIGSRRLLKLRYLDGLPWKEVAEKIIYDETYTKKDLHSKALQKFYTTNPDIRKMKI